MFIKFQKSWSILKSICWNFRKVHQYSNKFTEFSEKKKVSQSLDGAAQFKCQRRELTKMRRLWCQIGNPIKTCECAGKNCIARGLFGALVPACWTNQTRARTSNSHWSLRPRLAPRLCRRNFSDGRSCRHPYNPSLCPWPSGRLRCRRLNLLRGDDLQLHLRCSTNSKHRSRVWPFHGVTDKLAGWLRAAARHATTKLRLQATVGGGGDGVVDGGDPKEKEGGGEKETSSASGPVDVVATRIFIFKKKSNLSNFDQVCTSKYQGL